MKQYIAIPGPKIIEMEKKGSVEEAMGSFAILINNYSQQGWIYHSMETIAVSSKAGCMQPAVVTNYYMLIFEREV